MNTSDLMTGWERMGILFFAMFLALMILLAREFLVNRYLISLSSKDKWWNPIRQKPLPAQYAIMLKNNEKGDFAKIIHSIPEHHLDENHNFVKDGDDPDYEPLKPGRLEKNGLVWVGFNKAYYRQPIEYTVWDKLENSAEYGAVTKKRNLIGSDPYYFFKYTTFLVHVIKAENLSKIPIDMKIIITVQHQNPYKVHFLTGKWTVRASALVERVVREVVSHMELEEIFKLRESTDDTILKALEAAVDTGALTFFEKYGLIFDDPELISIEPVVDKETADAMKAQSVAELQAKAVKAENERTVRKAIGEARSTKIRYGAINSVPNGPFLKFTESIGGLKTLVMGGNHGVTIPLPDEDKP